MAGSREWWPTCACVNCPTVGRAALSPTPKPVAELEVDVEAVLHRPLEPMLEPVLELARSVTSLPSRRSTSALRLIRIGMS